MAPQQTRDIEKMLLSTTLAQHVFNVSCFLGRYTRCHATLKLCCFTVEPPSQTLKQHQINTMSIVSFLLDRTLLWIWVMEKKFVSHWRNVAKYHKKCRNIISSSASDFIAMFSNMIKTGMTVLSNHGNRDVHSCSDTDMNLYAVPTAAPRNL